VPRLHLKELADAEAFLECYGFDWQTPGDRRRLERIRAEAIAFVEEELLIDEPDLRMPAELRGQSDVRELLLWASDRPRRPRQRWSCAILRVMHTLAHATTDLNDYFGGQIVEQILARFRPHLQGEGEELLLGHGEQAIPLVRFQIKHIKPLRSIVTKLLQKPENVATDIFDRVGVRFITHHRFDALLVVRYLRAHNVIMFANIKPSRSRNTLVDIGELRKAIDQLDAEGVVDGQSRLAALRERIARQSFPAPPTTYLNPFSSTSYHAIQFTCRQQVRIANPMAESVAREVSRLDADYPECAGFSDGIRERLRQQEEIRFFFPFEIQILDRKSFEASRTGRASHEVYKARQRAAIKRRVLGGLLRRPKIT
jgi:uncharacterized protein (TIGR04562 family)